MAVPHTPSEAVRDLVVSALSSHCLCSRGRAAFHHQTNCVHLWQWWPSATTGPNGCPDVGFPILRSGLSFAPNSRSSKRQLTSGTLNIRSQSFKISDLNFQLEKLGRKGKSNKVSREQVRQGWEFLLRKTNTEMQIFEDQTCFSENIIQITNRGKTI